MLRLPILFFVCFALGAQNLKAEPDVLKQHHQRAQEYILNKRLGPGIFLLEKCLWEKPNSANLINDLKLVRGLLPLEYPKEKNFFSAHLKRDITKVAPLSNNAWQMAWVFAFIVLAIGVFRFFWGKAQRGKQALRSLQVCATLFLMVMLLFGLYHRQYLKSDKRGIVFSHCSLMSEPYSKGIVNESVSEGAALQIETQVGDWSEVELSNGQRGWIQNKNFVLLSDQDWKKQMP